MLIEFSVANFLSFKERVTFSMVASHKNEFAETHTFQITDNISLLKSGVVYGANASGKSNLFAAIGFMKTFIEESAKDMMAEEPIGVEPFRLSTETANQPSSFEIVFMYENVQYRYGFQVTSAKILKEWLYYSPNRRETKLFFRDNNSFDIGASFKEESSGLETKTRDNALFISVVALFNGTISKKVLKWFKNFNILFNVNKNIQGYTSRLSQQDPTFQKFMVKCLKVADLGIEDYEVIDWDPPAELTTTLKLITETTKNVKVNFDKKLTDVHVIYKKYDENGEFVSFEKFDLDVEESNGTRNLYSLLGPIFDTLMHGKMLAIDELDFGLHPLLTLFIVNLFHSSEANPHNAQLIFNSHNTNLLSNKIFRRDQIWFTEKDRFGATDLYSLIEYSVRKDASFGKDYLLGKYGAIPFIGELDDIFAKDLGGESDGE